MLKCHKISQKKIRSVEEKRRIIFHDLSKGPEKDAESNIESKLGNLEKRSQELKRPII